MITFELIRKDDDSVVLSGTALTVGLAKTLAAQWVNSMRYAVYSAAKAEGYQATDIPQKKDYRLSIKTDE